MPLTHDPILGIHALYVKVIPFMLPIGSQNQKKPAHAMNSKPSKPMRRSRSQGLTTHRIASHTNAVHCSTRYMTIDTFMTVGGCTGPLGTGVKKGPVTHFHKM